MNRALMASMLLSPSILLGVLGFANPGWGVEPTTVNYEARVGELHPDFRLPDIESGEPVSLANFRGKKVLLIHFASW